MDFLLDALTNWLKEMLVGGIMGNLTGMFDSVNQQVADIATQVGTGMVTAKKQEADQTQQIEQQQQATSLSGLISDTVAKVVLGIAGGSAKTVSELGWWGLPLVAVISAALMGLLNFALSAIGGSSGGNKTSAPNKKIKLASGMLTYDEGNNTGAHHQR